MNPEFNFCHKNSIVDVDMMFGPISFYDERDNIIIFDDSWDMADVLVACGIFQSKTQARKNTPDLTIPSGWSDFTRTKKKIRICIWNPK